MKKVAVTLLLASLLGFVSLEAWAAFIDVTSKPVGARVKVDGKDEGTTPLLLDLAAGRYQLEVEKKGYIGHRETLTVSGDGAMTVELEKEAPPPPSKAELREQEQARKAREAEAARKVREVEQARKEREEREKKERALTELERQESELARLDGEIAAMKQRLEKGGARTGDSLEAMLALVEKRDAQAGKVAEERNAQAAALAERERQKSAAKAAAEDKRRNAIEGDISKYEKIVNSSGGSSLGGAAWAGLVGQYSAGAGIEQGDLATFRQVVIEGISLAELRERERERERERVAAAEARRLAELAGEMVDVPGGCFKMGDNFGGGDSDEKPVHEVCVDGFRIGKYEVTQGQWRSVMGNNPANFQKGDNYPVEQVSWNDVQEYIRKLNSKTGQNFRLPTEAEWEYAVRSGGKAEKYAGGNNVDALAWYRSNSGSTTHPVGTKSPNGLGIYDMSGNVWEWCQDWFDSGYYGSSPRNNPSGPSSGAHRVERGGSWYGDARNVRTAIRYGLTPAVRSGYLGFRLALPAGQ